MKPTIRNKLVAGFAAVLLLMAAVAVIGGYAVLSLRRSAYEATRIGARLNSVAIEIQVHNLEAERRVKNYLAKSKAGTDKNAGDMYIEEAKFEIHEIQSLAAKAIEISPTSVMRARFQKIAETVSQYEQALDRVVQANKAATDTPAASAAIAEYEEVADNLHDSAEDGELAGHDASQASLESIERTSRKSVNLVVGISVLGLALGVLVSYLLARAILIPVKHLKDVAENVSMGNLNVAVKRYSDDEIGDLADSFSRMVTAVKFFRSEAEADRVPAVAEVGSR